MTFLGKAVHVASGGYEQEYGRTLSFCRTEARLVQPCPLITPWSVENDPSLGKENTKPWSLCFSFGQFFVFEDSLAEDNNNNNNHCSHSFSVCPKRHRPRHGVHHPAVAEWYHIPVRRTVDVWWWPWKGSQTKIHSTGKLAEGISCRKTVKVRNLAQSQGDVWMKGFGLVIHFDPIVNLPNNNLYMFLWWAMVGFS